MRTEFVRFVKICGHPAGVCPHIIFPATPPSSASPARASRSAVRRRPSRQTARTSSRTSRPSSRDGRPSAGSPSPPPTCVEVGVEHRDLAAPLRAQGRLDALRAGVDFLDQLREIGPIGIAPPVPDAALADEIELARAVGIVVGIAPRDGEASASRPRPRRPSRHRPPPCRRPRSGRHRHVGAPGRKRHAKRRRGDESLHRIEHVYRIHRESLPWVCLATV